MQLPDIVLSCIVYPCMPNQSTLQSKPLGELIAAKQARKFVANVRRRHRRHSWHEEVVSPGHGLHDVTLYLQFHSDEVEEWRNKVAQSRLRITAFAQNPLPFL